MKINKTEDKKRAKIEVNRKLIYIFKPLVFLKLVRSNVLFGEGRFTYLMRNKAFINHFFAGRSLFNFRLLTCLVRASFLFFYQLIVRTPRSCIIVINGVRNDFSLTNLFEKAQTIIRCAYLLTWFPGFLSNFKNARFAYIRQYLLLIRKKNLTKRQIKQLYLAKVDAKLVNNNTSLWRFPNLVIFLYSSWFYSVAAREANTLRIPSISLINSDTLAWLDSPYFIPWNALTNHSIELFLQLISETLLRGFLSNLFHKDLGEWAYETRLESILPIQEERFLNEKLTAAQRRDRLKAFYGNPIIRTLFSNKRLFYNLRKRIKRLIRRKISTLRFISKLSLLVNSTFYKERTPFNQISFVYLFLFRKFLRINYCRSDLFQSKKIMKW